MSAQTDVTVTVQRIDRNRIAWSPELLAALRADRERGMVYRQLSDRYGISESVLRDHLDGAQPRVAMAVPLRDHMPAPALPPYLGRPPLPCGCRRGSPCQRALGLRAAMDAERFGSREWAERRQAWLRHVSGEEARETECSGC